jgi:hypothetical protein
LHLVGREHDLASVDGGVPVEHRRDPLPLHEHGGRALDAVDHRAVGPEDDHER